MRAILALIVLGTVTSAAAAADAFDLAEPATLSPALSLWATQYYVHQAMDTADGGGIQLTDDDDAPLGVALGHADWCDAALEGTVTIDSQGEVSTYNYSDRKRKNLVDCSKRFKSLSKATVTALGHTTFAEVPSDAPYGLGAKPSYRLVPGRSVAVDRKKFSLGTVFYIPALRGKTFEMPDGTKKPHDGYFMAVDVGGAIKGDHIDVFTGTMTSNPAPMVITSTPKGTFAAHVVKDVAIVDYLKDLHLRD